MRRARLPQRAQGPSLGPEYLDLDRQYDGLDLLHEVRIFALDTSVAVSIGQGAHAAPAPRRLASVARQAQRGETYLG